MARASKQKASEHRDAVLKAAMRLFRERGPDGVGVAEITHAAGLTHGGFYGQFDSKDALLAEAVRECLKEMVARIETERRNDEELAQFVETYLSLAHCAEPGTGCPIAALGGDVARQSPDVQKAFAGGLRNFLVAMGAGQTTDEQTRLRVLNQASRLVGAIVMARATMAVDEELARDILDAARRDAGPVAQQS